METLNIPEVSILQKGESFKVLLVNGYAGMLMPSHYSTKEAIIMVQKGSAVLTMNEQKHILKEGNVFIIPATQIHTLLLTDEFKAAVIMALDSAIEFKN